MNTEDRSAFDTRLAQVFGAIDKPFSPARADGFWKGLERMSLQQFNRACDQVLRELEAGEAPRTFTVASVWRAYKALRAAAPEQPITRPWQGDVWDERAGLRLLVYIRNQAAAGVHYCCPRTRMGLHPARLEPTPETAQLTAVLVAWKNAWARDCREESPAPSRETADRWWSDCMQRAEVEVAAVRARYATAAA